jgi:hypothetical protein
VTLEVQAPGTRSGAIAVLLFFGVFAALYAVSDTPQVALVFLPAVPAAVRLAFLRLSVDGDRLRVRNFWRTHDLARSDIAGFEVHDDLESRFSRRRMVYARLGGGRRCRLSATKRPYRRRLAFLPVAGKRNHADEICEELDAWLGRPA